MSVSKEEKKIILAFLRASMNVIALMHSDRYGIDIDPDEEEERRIDLLNSFETFYDGASELDDSDIEEIEDFLKVVELLK